MSLFSTLCLLIVLSYSWICYGRTSEDCQVQLVESIPQGLIYNSSISHKNTYDVWSELLVIAENKLELASSYWSLRPTEEIHDSDSDWQGSDIFNQLIEASNRGIAIDIAQNNQFNADTEELAKYPGIHVKSLDFPTLIGEGILHTKLWIVDRRHFYVGSANFDWRSLTQVKEMGVLVKNCPALANDMGKIMDVYWKLGGVNQSIPTSWPKDFETNINSTNPLWLKDRNFSVFLSSSPPAFCPSGRSTDIDALLHVIDEAKEFIYISVMDYFPRTLYSQNVTFWPLIDNHLRQAAIERGVKIRLLFSDWKHSRPYLINYLKSLVDLSYGTSVDIQGKLFKVPSFTPEQENIPYARVNHNKYMVTDKESTIGTSNWSADYFISTGGISFVFSGQELRKDLKRVFLRDWNSDYAHSIF